MKLTMEEREQLVAAVNVLEHNRVICDEHIEFLKDGCENCDHEWHQQATIDYLRSLYGN